MNEADKCARGRAVASAQRYSTPTAAAAAAAADSASSTTTMIRMSTAETVSSTHACQLLLAVFGCLWLVRNINYIKLTLK